MSTIELIYTVVAIAAGAYATVAFMIALFSEKKEGEDFLSKFGKFFGIK